VGAALLVGAADDGVVAAALAAPAAAPDVPLIDEAAAVTSRRTSRSLSLVASSRSAAVCPLVPVADGAGEAAVPSGPMRSVRILSTAAASVPHFGVAAFAPDVAPFSTSFSRLFRCDFSCPSCDFALAGTVLVSIEPSACFAAFTCSAGVSAAVCADGVAAVCAADGCGCVWGLAGVCASTAAGRPINAAAAIAVVQPDVERFITQPS
jgi:hypothetical protein